MRIRHWYGGALFGALALIATGCGQTQDKGGQAKEKEGQDTAQVAKKQKDDHSGWWCPEHGIPEEECSMCLPADVVQKRFKDKGDWCEEHDRAKSQCFICDPSLKEQYAAKYRAKYGKEPPPIGEELPEEKK